jgi:hypothetical protein
MSMIIKETRGAGEVAPIQADSKPLTRYWHVTTAVAMDDPKSPEPPEVTEQKLAAF